MSFIKSFFLYKTFNFQFKFNTAEYLLLKKKHLDFKFITATTTIIYLLLLLVCTYFFKKFNFYIFNPLISSLILSSILLLILSFYLQKKINTTISNFIKYINNNSNYEVNSFEEFKRLRLIIFLHELCNLHNLNVQDCFEKLCDLINHKINNKKSSDYIDNYSMIIYAGSFTFAGAIFEKALDNYIFFTISIIFIVTIIYWIFFFRKLFPNRFLKEIKNYNYLLFLLEQSKYDYLYLVKCFGDKYIDKISEINQLLINFK